MTLHATVGDWLIVAGPSDHSHERRAQIISVSAPTGEPPYQVRWLDTGHVGLVFPGPDATVVSPEHLAEIDRAAATRSGHFS